MSVTDRAGLDGLMAKVAELGRMSEEDAHRIVQEVYADGVVSRAEADALFDLNDRMSGEDELWDARFREAIKDFLLTVEAPIGWVSDEQCAWLVERISRDGEIRLASEIDLLLDVLRYAEGAPMLLAEFALEAACDHARHKGRVSGDDADRIRRAVFARASDGAAWVTKREAAQLFKLNDAVGAARNGAGWNDLFARAIGNYLMSVAHPEPHSRRDALDRERWLEAGSAGVGAMFAEAVSSLSDGSWFAKVTYSPEKAAEARMAAQAAARRNEDRSGEDAGSDWFIKRLGWDVSVTAAERALIEFLKAEAPGFAEGIFATA